MKVGDREDRGKGTEQKGSVEERSKRKWGNEGRDSNGSWCLLIRILLNKSRHMSELKFYYMTYHWGILLVSPGSKKIPNICHMV